jgi:hypothetical protein
LPAPAPARATALAAVFEAAAQVADPATLATLRGSGIVSEVSPEFDRAFPERVAVREAVARWPDARKQAALAWVRANATWNTLLRALAIESFTDALEPREWGPAMSRFDPAIFSRRAGLAPLLRDALEDRTVRALAGRMSAPRDGFTAADVAAHRQRMLRYLRLPDEYPPFAAYYDTLMYPGNGVNAELPDGTVLFVVGPALDSGTASMVLAHELAHRPVDRVLADPAVVDALEASRCAFVPIAVHHGYNTWRSFFAEALVRSLSYRLQGIDALDTGFVFEAELAADLQRWEAGEGASFGEAVRGMLDGIRTRHCP